jgi:microcystin-dependent protein
MTVDDIYQIGSYYETSNTAFNPNEYGPFAGTTWTEDTDACVLISSPNGSAATNIGVLTGADTVTLTTAQMPSHYHTVSLNVLTPNTSTTSYGNTVRTQNLRCGHNYTSTAYTRQWGTGTTTWRNTGGGQAHNNMQPYIGVKRWRRTA